jgi:hypothetical protein
MGVRKTEDKAVRRLFAVGYQRSIAVVLPAEEMRRLGWNAGKEVIVKRQGRTITIFARV